MLDVTMFGAEDTIISLPDPKDLMRTAHSKEPGNDEKINRIAKDILIDLSQKMVDAAAAGETYIFGKFPEEMANMPYYMQQIIFGKVAMTLKKIDKAPVGINKSTGGLNWYFGRYILPNKPGEPENCYISDPAHDNWEKIPENDVVLSGTYTLDWACTSSLDADGD